MAIELTWHGHNTWILKTGSHRIVVDPFFDENPSCTLKCDDVAADFILISHGHFDHIADAAKLANRTGATCVAIFEIAEWLSEKHKVEKTVGMNIGGATKLPFGEVEMTIAFHSSQLPDGSYGGVAAGLLITIDDKKLYFACDTALFSDMSLIGNKGIDVAVVPIGDLFTMGPEVSVESIKLIKPKRVLPCHYNTWPPIEQDANAWSAMVKSNTNAEPVVLESGQSMTV